MRPLTFEQAVPLLSDANQIEYYVTSADFDGALMTVDTYRGYVECGAFIDDDGYGMQLDQQGQDLGPHTWPSNVNRLHKQCAYVLWSNR